MAWVTPTNVATGDVLTASKWNQDVVANTIALRGDWAQSRSSSNYTLNNTSWTDVDTGLDLTLAAAAGDVIEVGLSALAGSDAVDGYLDAVTVVSGTATNSFATGGTLPSGSHQGVMAWRGSSNTTASLGGSVWYKLVSGDVSSSAVVLRLRYRTSTATNKILFGSTVTPLVFTARNHGPVEA